MYAILYEKLLIHDSYFGLTISQRVLAFKGYKEASKSHRSYHVYVTASMSNNTNKCLTTNQPSHCTHCRFHGQYGQTERLRTVVHWQRNKSKTRRQLIDFLKINQLKKGEVAMVRGHSCTRSASEMPPGTKLSGNYLQVSVSVLFASFILLLDIYKAKMSAGKSTNTLQPSEAHSPSFTLPIDRNPSIKGLQRPSSASRLCTTEKMDVIAVSHPNRPSSVQLPSASDSRLVMSSEKDSTNTSSFVEQYPVRTRYQEEFSYNPADLEFQRPDDSTCHASDSRSSTPGIPSSKDIGSTQAHDRNGKEDTTSRWNAFADLRSGKYGLHSVALHSSRTQGVSNSSAQRPRAKTALGVDHSPQSQMRMISITFRLRQSFPLRKQNNAQYTRRRLKMFISQLVGRGCLLRTATESTFTLQLGNGKF